MYPVSADFAPDQTFSSRFAEAGLLVYRCGADGARLLPLAPNQALDAWTSSSVAGDLIAQAMTRRDTCSGQAELYAGCRIVWAPDPSAAGSLVLLVPTTPALHGTTFATLCASAKLTLDSTIEALDPFMKHTLTQVDQAVSTFRQLCQLLSWCHKSEGMVNQFTSKLTQAYEELNLFFRLAGSLNASVSTSETIQTICEEVQQILPFSWVAASFAADGVQLPELAGRTIVGGVLPCMPATLAAAVREACRSTPWKAIHNPGDTVISNLVGSQVAAEIISHRGKPIAALLGGGKAGPDAEVTSEELQLLRAAAGFIGVFHENVARFEEQKALFVATVRSLAASIDAKDRYTRGHSERVSTLAAALARALGLQGETVEQYRVAGLLHDVGKIGTPESILTKMNRLTDEEFREIMKHPRTGYEILKDIPGIAFALPGVLHHHERYDGTGYPTKLAGQQIPLIARVLALADTFDAMRSNRAYRSARPHEAVIAEIRKCAGTQFDPKLAAVFVELDFTEFERMLDNGSEEPLAA